MRCERPWLRLLLAATASGLLIAAMGAPIASAQQDRCLPPGTNHAPIPWSQKAMGPEQVWPLSNGAGQRVAVVGTGVADNPFLAGQINARTNVAPPTENTNDSGREDCLGTGTGAAGIIAGKKTGGLGFHGMAPGARILSAKVVRDQHPNNREPRGSVSPEVLANGINWAIDQNATVIAVTEVTYQDGGALRAAVGRALGADIPVIAAVGEPSQDEPPGLIPFPAALDGVLGVGSITEQGVRSGASRSSRVDLVAPGENVVTSYPGRGLGPATGTGYATAYVAGTAALVKARISGLSPSDLAHRLFATAAPAPEGVGSASYGYGLVNPYAATLDRTVAGDPGTLPELQPQEVTAEELAREREHDRSNSLAYGLTAAGLGVVGVVTAVVVFGPKGSRRKWRSGISTRRLDRAEDEGPESPVDLFGDRR
ncbi:subtilase family protein [Tamaricihabitans halophyticus]|uniref:Subtilase family protein n=1 Tax=Tamaricihabitans halophyticus TaxID=1262583 RepID=A0A4R2QV29_9PSEU|nr:S8 family serine peptidase [Tamaricihabitans halophyticus]TCP53587.1 subtilase family protein [Tamaricihabitans halophyticus]